MATGHNATRWDQTTDDLPYYDYVEEMVTHYLTCAVWADLEEGTEHDLDSSDLSCWTARSIAEAYIDCADFARRTWADLAIIDAEQAGHDFYLTTRGHGTGFWDRGLGEVGERLTEACKGSHLGSVGVYYGDGLFSFD